MEEKTQSHHTTRHIPNSKSRTPLLHKPPPFHHVHTNHPPFPSSPQQNLSLAPSNLHSSYYYYYYCFYSQFRNTLPSTPLLPLPSPPSDQRFFHPMTKALPLSPVSGSIEKALVVAKRPDSGGQEGSVIYLLANHFLVNSLQKIYHNNVEISPHPSKEIARMIKQKLVETESSSFSVALPAFDGRKNIYSLVEFQEDRLEFFVNLRIPSCNILMKCGDLRGKKPQKKIDKIFRVNTRLVSKFDGKEQRKEGENWAPLPREYIHALDVILRENPMEKCTSIGRSFYSSFMGGSKEIGGGALGLRGFFQSLRHTQQGLALNMDLSIAAFHESIGVIAYLQKRLDFHKDFSRNKSRELSLEERRDVEKALKNIRVFVCNRENVQRYRVYGLTEEITENIWFPDRDGKHLRLVIYFKDHYGQNFLGKLSDDQAAKIMQTGCQRPNERKAIIDNVMAGLVGPASGTQTREFNLEVSRDMTFLKGRILQPPKLKHDRPSNLLESRAFRGTRVERWALMSIGGSPDQKSTIPKFINELIQKKHKGYGHLKRIAETRIGVVTQCCLYPNITKLSSQFVSNLALKIIAKIGGSMTGLYNSIPYHIPRLFRVDEPVIFMGADVTHPHPFDDCSPSVAAVVGSINWPEANRYVSRMRSQIHRKEIIQDLDLMVKELLDDFYKALKKLPNRIIFFRDGVSETQFKKVLQEELQSIKAACSKFQVVDTVITHPKEFDFYLCSHLGVKGTSRPTHYHVLWDENEFTSDELQRFVYNLCYTFVRCKKFVSIVPPAYYAHLAAYGRLYI
ncbi:hypothetical protein Bca101_027363 [Brassica carinata]